MSALLEAALQYAARGWKIIPLWWIRNGVCACKEGAKCTAPGKHPRIKTGKGHCEFASCDPVQIEKWWRRWPDANVGAATGQASGFVVVDIDGAKGVSLLVDLVEANGLLPRTLQSRSGRAGGGHHAFYAWDRPSPTNSGQGLDIRGDQGLVVLPPSLHVSGARYAWANAEPMAHGPAWLLDWFAHRPGEGKGARAVLPALNLGQRPDWLEAPGGLAERLADTLAEDVPIAAGDLVAAASVIPNPDLGWEPWRNMLLRFWAASGGSDEGREAGHVYSRKSKKYDPAKTDANWEEVGRSPPSRTGFGALINLAREAVPGWEPPSRQRVEVVPQEMNGFDPNLLHANGKHTLPSQITQADQSNPLIRLNEDYSVIGNVGGKCLVLSWVSSHIDQTLKVPCFQTFKSFSERYANRYVKVEEEPKQLGAYWLKWTGRKSFEGIDLVPGAPATLSNGYLNLWTGFAVPPAAGEWGLMQRHILQVLAAGDAELARYIFRFAAWAVQHPGERAEVALVFRGGKGSGKGTFANAVRSLFGQHGLQIFNSKHLVGAFNGHLRNCLFLFADEAFWAGDKQGESVLKGMLTEPTLMIEQKGVDATPWPNRLHVIMAANADWAVPASHDERRYVVCDVSGDQIGDRAYFKALHDEMRTGGLQGMMGALLACELGDWHPRQIVQTEGLRLQKERSLKPIEAWWASFLDDGILPGVIPGRPHVPAAMLLEMAREHSPRADITANALGRFLAERMAERLHRDEGNCWKIPDLAACRQEWEKRFGGWKWREKYEEWKKPA